MSDFTSVLKDRGIFLGWIAGLALIAILLWSLSFPFRAARLMQSTNKVLSAVEDTRVLSAPVSQPYAGPVSLGCWYRITNSNSLFFVFVIMRDGILVPCGAEISAYGEVIEVLPLGNHARRVFDRLPKGLIQIYVRRIETAAARRMRA